MDDLLPSSAEAAFQEIDKIKRVLLDERWRTGTTMALNESLCSQLFNRTYETMNILELKYLQKYFEALPSAKA